MAGTFLSKGDGDDVYFSFMTLVDPGSKRRVGRHERRTENCKRGERGLVQV